MVMCGHRMPAPPRTTPTLGISALVLHALEVVVLDGLAELAHGDVAILVGVKL